MVADYELENAIACIPDNIVYFQVERGRGPRHLDANINHLLFVIGKVDRLVVEEGAPGIHRASAAVGGQRLLWIRIGGDDA